MGCMVLGLGLLAITYSVRRYPGLWRTRYRPCGTVPSMQLKADQAQPRHPHVLSSGPANVLHP